MTDGLKARTEAKMQEDRHFKIIDNLNLIEFYDK